MAKTKFNRPRRPLVTQTADIQSTGIDPYSMNTGFMINRTIKPVKGFGPQHPFNNPDNHQKLLMHIKQRLDLSRQTRDELNIRLRNIDQDLAGFVRYSDDDKKRVIENRKGKSQKPVDVSLPLAMAKIDDLLTYMLEIFFPSSEGMFGAQSSVQNQSIANAFATELNTQGKQRGFYHKFARFILDALKYNISAIAVEWVEEKGFKITNNATKQLDIKKDEVVYEGNDLENIDIYNFFYDPTVIHLSEISTKGEWAAHSKMLTRFHVQKLSLAGILHGVENWIATATPQTGSLYYAERPVVRFDYNANTGSVDWIKFAAGDLYTTIGWGVELVWMYVWINPKQFGLSEDNELQIWRLGMANAQWICHAEQMPNAHNQLPVLVTVPLEDNLGLQRKSSAELLTDLNRFASFLMNAHQQAVRKKLFGLTIYDPNAIDMKDLGDDTSGRVPLQPQAWGKDIRTLIQQFKDAPETTETVNDIKGLIDLLEYILPTNQQKQVADLDRATTYQAAATVQGANRRSLKTAKIIDDQAVVKMRMMMMWNTLQFKESIKGPDPQNPQGPQIDLPTASFRDLGLEYDTGEGIQGIDRIMMVHLLHDVINAMLQSQEAQKQVDLVGLIDYWIKLFGQKIDIAQFKYPTNTNPQAQAEQQQQTDQNKAQVDNLATLAGAHADTQPQGDAGAAPAGNGAGGADIAQLLSSLTPQGKA